MAPVAHLATVLTPRELRHVPVEVLQRKPMIDADIGPLDPREEALDLVGVRAIVGLIGLRVVDALQLVQASQSRGLYLPLTDMAGKPNSTAYPGKSNCIVTFCGAMLGGVVQCLVGKMHARVKATIIGAVCIIAAWAPWPRFDRASMENNWGQTVADYFHGECDLPFRAFVRRDRTTIAATEQISDRFVRSGVTSRIYPVLKEEEAHAIFAVERAFAWDSRGAQFQVWRRENGDVTFQPVNPSGGHLMDGIKMDECGYLVGDDYQARQRHAAAFNEHR